ncbi:MAG: hypothetical protein ACK5ZR_00985, partial [Gemmatimonadaceae bacterium]
KQEAIMSTKISRLATGVFAVLMGVAVMSVSTAWAADFSEDFEDPISTTCGAGTVEPCAQKPITECSWEFSFSLNPKDKNFGITIKKTNCVVVGHVPIYKNQTHNSALSRSCDYLAPFMGMPAGSGCSD